MNDSTENPTEKQNKELFGQVKNMPEAPKRNKFNGVALPSTTYSKGSLFTRKLKMFLYLIIALLIVSVVIGSVLIMKHGSPATQGADEIVGSTIKANILSIEGKVESSTDGQNWQEVEAGQNLTTSTYVRTLDQGRAEITLEDKSLLRLDYDTQIKITNLSNSKLRFENLGGKVWARTVQSGHRQLEVTLENIRFLSHESAFISINSKEVKGVEVYQGQVETPDPFNEKITEGKAFYLLSPDDEQQTVLDIDTDKLKVDDFIKWNIEKDSNNPNYTDKKGITDSI